MTATDLDTLNLSDDARQWVTTADPAADIFNHEITVDLDWWNAAIGRRGLPDGPVAGLSPAGEVVDSGRCIITRGHVFSLSLGAPDDPRYFAGEGRFDHRCLILDSRVAGALIRLGWASLRTDGAWPAATYERYVHLLNRWRQELADHDGEHPRADLIERWLFDNHAADVPEDE